MRDLIGGSLEKTLRVSIIVNTIMHALAGTLFTCMYH